MIDDARVEAAFARGRDAPDEAGVPADLEPQLQHWWTRGFSYSQRLQRAIRAEIECEKLRADNLLLRAHCDSMGKSSG